MGKQITTSLGNKTRFRQLVDSFGLPRIIINEENIHRMLKMVDNPHNGLTLCTGSLGTNRKNNLP